MKKTINTSSALTLGALGLCFGLILVGSTSVFPQSAISRHENPGKTQKADGEKRNTERAVEQFAATLEDLYRAASEISGAADPSEKDRFNLNYFVSVKKNGAWRFSANPASGGDSSAWSGRYREPLQRLYDAFLPQTDEWDDDMLVQFSIGPDDVSLKAIVEMSHDDNVSALTGFDQSLMKRRSAASDPVRSQIYGASQVTVQKDKVIIAANLPRAGLETLLTKTDK
jgi:hypothetical protein